MLAGFELESFFNEQGLGAGGGFRFRGNKRPPSGGQTSAKYGLSLAVGRVKSEFLGHNQVK